MNINKQVSSHSIPVPLLLGGGGKLIPGTRKEAATEAYTEPFIFSPAQMQSDTKETAFLLTLAWFAYGTCFFLSHISSWTDMLGTPGWKSVPGEHGLSKGRLGQRSPSCFSSPRKKVKEGKKGFSFILLWQKNTPACWMLTELHQSNSHSFCKTSFSFHYSHPFTLKLQLRIQVHPCSKLKAGFPGWLV